MEVKSSFHNQLSRSVNDKKYGVSFEPSIIVPNDSKYFLMWIVHIVWNEVKHWHSDIVVAK